MLQALHRFRHCPINFGAEEALRTELIQALGDAYFQKYRRSESDREAIFTRKVGHTQYHLINTDINKRIRYLREDA